MGKKIIKCTPLPTELIFEIFSHMPTRQLCKFMTLSKSMNTEIRRILIIRFNDTFWNSHRRLLVLTTKYLLEFVAINNTFDLKFHKFDKTTLHATFILDNTQPIGTLGPDHAKLWGLKLRGDGILRDNFMNEPLLCSDYCPTEVNESRIYVFDSQTDKEHPFLKTFFVTNGQLKTPTNECKSTDGRWNSCIMSKSKNKLPKAKIIGRNRRKMEDEDEDNINNSSSNDDVNNNSSNNSNDNNNNNNNSNDDNNNNNNSSNNNSSGGQVFGVIESVIIKAPMLMASIEEKTQDKYIGGVKFIVLDGGQKYLKRKKTCIIS